MLSPVMLTSCLGLNEFFADADRDGKCCIVGKRPNMIIIYLFICNYIVNGYKYVYSVGYDVIIIMI